jgi:hypothetical protein
MACPLFAPHRGGALSETPQRLSPSLFADAGRIVPAMHGAAWVGGNPTRLQTKRLAGALAGTLSGAMSGAMSRPLTGRSEQIRSGLAT